MTDISSDVLRGYNDSIILSVLLDEDSYGYRISKRIRARCGERYVMKETTLYSAMNRLERTGLVRSYAGQESQGKARTYYHITEAGRQYLALRRTEWALTQEVLAVFLDDDGAAAGQHGATDKEG